MIGHANLEDTAEPISLHAVQATAKRSTHEQPSTDNAANTLEFLSPYGFFGINELLWRGPPPELTIRVTGHDEVRGHTMYNLECSLASCPVTARGARNTLGLNWKTSLRLTQLRHGLHDPVRRSLGSSYPTYFCKVPFAHHLRPKGTTARLDAWCRRLGACVTQSLVPPWIAAVTLKLLSAPPPARRTNGMQSVDDRQAGTISRGLDADKISLKPPSEGTTRPPSEVAASSNGEVGGDAAASDGDAPASVGDRTSDITAKDAEGVEVAEDVEVSDRCVEARDQEETPSDCVSDEDAFSDFDGCPVADDQVGFDCNDLGSGREGCPLAGNSVSADATTVTAATAGDCHAAEQASSDHAFRESFGNSISSILAVATAAEIEDDAEFDSVPPADSIASILAAATAEQIDDPLSADATQTAGDSGRGDRVACDMASLSTV
eukprot:TRINITY_DN48757_c0_g1_i1.p1 TRINITY_DN48757_c0_g1~~TRINITY_DN48757_c0_g1_i1.p1  ORF type:complete len:436 (-),score=74.50 TRINITY_DN48757_c0_g1_i1:249-1556(-)